MKYELVSSRMLWVHKRVEIHKLVKPTCYIPKNSDNGRSRVSFWRKLCNILNEYYPGEKNTLLSDQAREYRKIDWAETKNK